ncbi:MAG: outer membrane protein transport protein [Bacteroidales bacterium]
MIKIKNIIAVALVAMPSMLMAQGAMDLLQFSQQDLTGTSRFVSMAGAMGAVGGDMSTIKQNPAGIGVFKSSDMSFSLALDFSKTNTSVDKRKVMSTNSTDFYLPSTGYVGYVDLGINNTLRSISWGFSFNNSTIFSSHSGGSLGSIGTSMTNYIAGITNNSGATMSDLSYDNNPYSNSNAPWVSILAYNSFLINPVEGSNNTYQGLYGDGTSTNSEFETIISGDIYEYNFSLGGNVLDKVYWGMNLGIYDLSYNSYTYYGEAMSDAYVSDKNGNISTGTASWGLENSLYTRGTGYDFKLGVIVKPINELRLGFAVHTPTFYSMKDVIYTTSAYDYSTGLSGSLEANEPYGGSSYYRMTTPWRFIASAATVLNNRMILSFDYERVNYNTMTMSSKSGVEYYDVTNEVNSYFKGSNIFRIGAEYRVTPKFSLRAGYSYQDSPVNSDVFENQIYVSTASTTPSYILEKSTQYITCGFGYSFGSLYTDLSYVYKNRESEYHAFTPVISDSYTEPSPTADINTINNQVSLTIGLRF